MFTSENASLERKAHVQFNLACRRLERATLLSNRALAALESGDAAAGTRDANEAVDLLGPGEDEDEAVAKIRNKARYRRALGLVLTGELKRAKADHAELRRVRFYRLGWQDLVLRADKLDASNAPLKKVGVKQPVAAGAARG